MQLHRRTFAILLAFLLQAPLSAAAEPPPRPLPPPTDYSFDDHLVGGEGVDAGLEVLRVRRGMPRESLIRVREHFVVELLKSVEQL